MASVHFWTEAPESFIAQTYWGVEAIKLSGHVIINSVHKLKITDFRLSSICSKEKNCKYEF